MSSPFVILGLPRSRTAWLAKFLTYKGWSCGHEELRHMRGLGDIKAWLSQDFTGACETAAAPWWRLLVKYRPDVKIVTIRRPVQEVVNSLLALDMQGHYSFNHEIISREIRRLDAKLDQIEARVPGVISIDYDDLREEWACAGIFEHCLGLPFDEDWWLKLDQENVQCSMIGLMRYFDANRSALKVLGAQAKHSILRDFASLSFVAPAAISLQSESFETFFRDGKALFSDHLVSVGEAPDNFWNKNIDLMRSLDELGAMQIVTARSNGKMFGYLMTVLAPSLEEPNRKSAAHTTFYASDLFPGLGLKLQRYALRQLNEHRIDELFLRAGVRGSGPKMSALYKRIGAEPDGEVFKLNLRD